MHPTRLHPFWRLLLCAIVVLVITAVASGVGAGVLFAFAPRLGLANLSPQKMAEKLTHDYGLWLTIMAYPPALFVVWLFRTQVDRRSWPSLGFHRAGWLSNFVLGAVTGILTLSVLFALMWLSGAVQFGGLSQDVLTRGWPYAILALSAYAVAFLLVGFMEETAFRGYALHNASEWFGWRGAVAFQAVIFALIHLTNVLGNPDPAALKSAIGALPSLALIAVFFALAYRKTGSLWFPIGFHAAWNFCLGCVFSQPVSAIGTFRLFDVRETGNNFLSGGDFGAEGSFFLIPIVVALIYVLWRSPDHPQALADFDVSEATNPQVAMMPVPQVAYAGAPPTISSSPLLMNEEEVTEERGNRFKARFGSAEGFDSDMLRELKQMQDARDEAERQRKEAIRAEQRAEEDRKEALRRAELAAKAATTTSIKKVPEGAETQTATAVSEEEPVTPTQTTEQPTLEKTASVASTPPEMPTEAPIEATPTAPSAPAAPAKPPTPVAQPAPIAPTQPVAPSPSNSPSETPTAPKKARPRW